MSRAVALALFGLLALVSGLCLAAYLVWQPLAAAAVGLVAVGAACLYAGLVFDLDRKE
jgi:1,4-dihydroxy-2-naphthoate octaprenyltransferase